MIYQTYSSTISISITEKDLLLEETIEIVCRNIGFKWKALADRILDTDEHRDFLQDLVESDTDDYEKSRACFKAIQDKITWTKLKDGLIFIDAQQIIKLAEEKSLLTIGIYIHFFHVFTVSFYTFRNSTSNSKSQKSFNIMIT